MNIVLWALQIVVALAFLAAGLPKIIMPIDQLAQRMTFVKVVPPLATRLIGVAEVLGAIGLIVPGVTHIAPILVPLAALGLVIAMAGAIVYHLTHNEASHVVGPVILLVLAAVIAYGRFFVVKL